VDSDKDLRFQIFFNVTNEIRINKTPEAIWGLQYNPIAQDLRQGATNDPLVWRYVTQLNDKLLENARLTDGCFQVVGETNYEACINLVNRIFYNAKNIVYQNDNYFTELGAIEMRKNFVLAILFDFMLLATAHLLLGVVYLARKKYKKMPLELCHWNARGMFYIGFLATYTVMFYCALLAYRVESASYNSRVFGYYATIAIQKNQSFTSEPGASPAKLWH